MIATLTTALLIWAAPPAPAVPASPAPVAAGLQEEVPDKRPEIKELVSEYEAHIKKRGDEDLEAVAVIDKLTQEFENSGPKDRATIVKALDKAFTVKRKETEEGLPDNGLVLAAANALGQMGPESVKPLSKWIDHKNHRDDMRLQRDLILSLGRTVDEGAIKTLIDLLPHRKAVVQAAAAEALGNFSGMELDVRKEIFEAMLKQLMSVKGQVDSDVNDIIARERYDVIAAPLITSLQKMSDQKFWDPNEWQHWWNKNKKEDWEDEGEA